MREHRKDCELTLADGRTVRTPIVEVKNLNSFRSLAGAIRYEIEHQPRRWLETGETHGPGMKSTRGWDDEHETTFLQRSKEDALDYRYFPEPDLPAVEIDAKWMGELRARMPESPLERLRRYHAELARPVRDAQALAFDIASAELYDAALARCAELDIPQPDAASIGANLILQCLARLAGERGTTIEALGMNPVTLAEIVALRHAGQISANGSEKLAELALAERTPVRAIAERERLIQVSDAGQLEAWCAEVIAEHAAIAEQVRAGKGAAIGRLIGEVMKKSGGSADAKAVREILMRRLDA